ncbi:penicillin acylase family protein [Adhaeribacter radiodurans]|uniref:Penicillin acylase family protein n=1 Tax=Adhaeribacter radiodurans TaxID=2745197 RepID=A0A7L7L6T9_9BACT|nr:penicillin acylase family protein [Adhaeribacter radiodurans]QMU28059.1 penicillin acylase family protein [Adhaeribacter radiodurans]
MKNLLFLLFLPLPLLAQKFTPTEINRWQQQAKQATIIRDNYGVPHIYGNTDADAVFGLLYAQCEDDFKRVEMNYIEKLGRMAEVKGEPELYKDLLIRLLIDSTDAIADYNKAEPWLKKLLNAYADGINYYLYKNPKVKPALLYRFKPWYPLLWTDGSIGAINTADVTVTELKNFYTGFPNFSSAIPKKAELPSGSNGFAFAPAKTESGNAILYINPHVTFYFRPEVQVQSKEGLNAYGAVTWGQFFVYQGFNEHCGWMHTSGNTDVADLYEEKIVKKNKALFYQFNNDLKPVTQKKISIRYLDGAALKTKTINTYYTHHGPIMTQRNGKWISLKSYNRSMVSLVQSWQRTKVQSFEEYKKAMDLKANTSNNTVYADDKGNIAYWHGNFIPVRDTKLDWSKPVDGSLAATEWKGLHKVDESVHLYNPASGWIQNCNSTPFTASGTSSPKKEKYPAYMAPDGENFRGINAVKIFNNSGKYTLEKVIADAYNTHLAAFDVLLPALLKAYNANKATATYQPLAGPIKILTEWDRNSSETSVATTLAIEWAQKLSPAIRQVYIDQGDADQVQKTEKFAETATADQLLAPLLEVKLELQSKFGKWQIAWGDINRYQRLSGDIDQKFDDTQPSLPSGFAPSTWGCLPSFVSRTYPGTNKRYGYNGNSFVCAVEFGKKIKAKSLLAGGNSGDPASKHFNDQALMYTKGQFKDVLFYKEDVEKHAEKTYHPGE